MEPQADLTSEPYFFDLGAGDCDVRRTVLIGDLDLQPGLLRVTGDFERRCLLADDPPPSAAAAATVSLRPRDCDATPLDTLEPLIPPPAGVLTLLPLPSADLVDLGVLSGALRLPVPLPKGGEALPPPPSPPLLLGESAVPPLRNGVKAHPGGGGLLLAAPFDDEVGLVVEARVPTGGVRLPEAAFWRVAMMGVVRQSVGGRAKSGAWGVEKGGVSCALM